MAAPVQMPSEVAQRILALLQANKVALFGVDAQVLYGDQDRIPVTPTVCVESGPTDRNLVGATNRTENRLICYIIIYWGKVQENQVDKLEGEQCAEGVVRFLDGNLQLELAGDGGIVVHGFVTDIDPGYIRRNERRTLMHAVRLTWTGKTKTMLGA